MVEQNALEALAIAGRGYILVDGRNSRSGPAAALAGDPDVRRIFLGGMTPHEPSDDMISRRDRPRPRPRPCVAAGLVAAPGLGPAARRSGSAR